MALADNLISYWSLSDANDAHGSNHLTNNNTVTFATGKVSNAGSFVAASSQSLSIASNTSLEAGDIDFTWAGWVYLTNVTTARTIFAKGADAASDYRLQALANANGFAWGVRNATNTSTTLANSGVQLVAATWYFVACRHNATANQISISVNAGTPVTASLSGGSRVSANAFAIGANNDASSPHNGMVDELGYWKRYLSDTEITELYNGGSGRDYAYISGGGGYTLTADAGTYTLTGTAASLKRGYLLTASAGSYAITGSDATLRLARLLAAANGSYSLTGIDAALRLARLLSAASGTYALTGIDATLTYTPLGAYILTAESGSYALTGTDATLTYGQVVAYILTADAGSYTLTGIAAALTYSGAQAAAPPLSRTYIVPAEDRTWVVEAESRIFVPA